MALAHDIRIADGGIFQRLAAVAREIQETRQRRRVFKQTLRELNQLSNRELADLGIARSMITRVAHEAAYGK
ncbi:DUF1127 domain-containing protein [Ostreiculturibacter nitratireducens]|uniref:DUF1127 domain-containing protein n=1 Tax=Ostreiculturibacter nitratireducens TaxID=3075226 RepID=UPI0031B629D8